MSEQNEGKREEEEDEGQAKPSFPLAFQRFLHHPPPPPSSSLLPPLRDTSHIAQNQSEPTR